MDRRAGKFLVATSEGHTYKPSGWKSSAKYDVRNERIISMGRGNQSSFDGYSNCSSLFIKRVKEESGITDFDIYYGTIFQGRS